MNAAGIGAGAGPAPVGPPNRKHGRAANVAMPESAKRQKTVPVFAIGKAPNKNKNKKHTVKVTKGGKRRVTRKRTTRKRMTRRRR